MGNKLGSAAEELLKDDEIRGGVKTTFKVIGWTIAGVVIFFVGRAAVKKAVKSYKSWKERKKIEEEVDSNKAKLSFDDATFDSLVSKLKTAMQTSKGYKNTYGFNVSAWANINYDESAITQVLKKLKNEFDWKELILKFGKIDGHTLREWLGLDDKGDVSSYNLILSNIGVKESDLIENIDLEFSVFGNMPTPIRY